MITSERSKQSFLLAVIHGSLRRHSDSSETRKKIEIKVYDHFRTSKWLKNKFEVNKISDFFW